MGTYPVCERLPGHLDVVFLCVNLPEHHVEFGKVVVPRGHGLQCEYTEECAKFP